MEQRSRILLPTELAQAVEQGVANGGRVVITVTGGSMVPALLHQRSQVELEAAGDIRVGHIVLVRRGDGSLVLHRVVKRQGDTLTLNGDAQIWIEQVDASQVLAKVCRICRKGKWHDSGTPGDKAYYKLWGLTRPVRPAMLKVYSKLKRK